jgi:CDP-glucose 4,6-dehydratase
MSMNVQDVERALPTSTAPPVAAASGSATSIARKNDTIGDIVAAEILAGSAIFAIKLRSAPFLPRPVRKLSFTSPPSRWFAALMPILWGLSPQTSWERRISSRQRACATVRAVVVVTTDKVYENREWAWPYREIDPLGGARSLQCQ